MRPRFHVPAVTPSAERVDLPDDEAEHLVRVLRLGVGDEVEVFDGRGGLWRAEVVQTSRKAATVRPLAPLTPAPELGVDVTLVMSVLKGDKMDDVVRDAVMLGVSALRPVVSERSETSLAAMARGSRIDRWRRIAVSSAKQCGRAVVPLVHEATTLERYWYDRSDAVIVMCVEPSVIRQPTSVGAVPRPRAAHILIGPEGGWSATEVSAARQSGAILMSLGKRTLRADAVPMVALTALLTTWGELS